MDELVDPIFAGKARNELSFVLTHASDEIFGNADIERPIAPACENIDEVPSVHLFVNRECAGPEMSLAEMPPTHE
jgi:hypothetical protein